MRPDNVLVATQNEGCILLSGVQEDQIVLVGSTMPTSLRTGTTSSMFILHPVPEQSGMVAINVISGRFGDKRYPKNFEFMLSVTWQDKPFVDLENQFVPAPGIYGQAVREHMEVRIDNVVYTDYEHLCGQNPKTRLVPDPDLLCRYLASQATAEEVIAAAEARTEEVSLREALKKSQEDSWHWQQKVLGLQEKLEKSDTVLHLWRGAAQGLRSAVHSQLFVNKAVRAKLAAYPDAESHPAPDFWPKMGT